MKSPRHILALGGGGFSQEESPLLDDYILSLGRRPRPRICFVPTASGDSPEYIERFHARFSASDCEPSHLELFRRSSADLGADVRRQDIFYVGGGNTANLLAIWRVHGLDSLLRLACEQGAVLAGISAGSVCWFEWGVTDSFGPDLGAIRGLGLLTGSNCPHYDGESARRPAYQRLVAEGMPGGLAADDGVALHFVDGSLHRVVSSRLEARAYRVDRSGAREVRETVVTPEYLGASRDS